MYQNACKMRSPPIGLMIIKHWSMDLPVFSINFGAQNFNFVLKNLGFFSHLCGFLCVKEHQILINTIVQKTTIIIHNNLVSDHINVITSSV